jgi:hypothetical protein
VGDIICPRYSSWVLLAAGAVGTLTGTPVEINGHFISMELMLRSQSLYQAFLLVPHVCPRSFAFRARSAAIMHSLLPDASCRNRRGALLLVSLSAARPPHGGWAEVSRPCTQRHSNGPITTVNHRTITARLYRCSPLGQTAHLLLISGDSSMTSSAFSVRSAPEFGQLRGLMQLHSTDNKTLSRFRAIASTWRRCAITPSKTTNDALVCRSWRFNYGLGWLV